MHRKPKNTAVATTSPYSEFTGPVTPVQIVLRIPDFGTRYGVGQRTVWKWLADGLPHYKLSPRQTRIPVPEADDWVKQFFLRKRHRR